MSLQTIPASQQEVQVVVDQLEQVEWVGKEELGDMPSMVVE